MAADRALEPAGVGDEERADLLVAAPGAAGHGLALLGARCAPGLQGAGLWLCSTSLPRKVKARPGGARSDSSRSPSGPAAGRREAVPLRSEHVAYAEPRFRAPVLTVKPSTRRR